MFIIFRFNCCGLDVHKTWIYACIGITDANGRTGHKEKRFSSFSRELHELDEWLTLYSCDEICMESAGKYWIPVVNVLEKNNNITLPHPQYTKLQKGNKTDRNNPLAEAVLDRIIHNAYELRIEAIDPNKDIFMREFYHVKLDDET